MFGKTIRLARLALGLGLVTTLAAAGCGDSSDAGGEGFGSDGGGLDPGVGQGGAQDFGQFRDILEDGDIPGPETIDDVGFFNEHKIDLPGANCGEDVCLHGLLGSMGNMITGSNCTMVLLGMNTPIDPAELERPPLNLAIAIDTSGSMSGDPIFYVRSGLEAMLDSLEPEDRVTLIGFDDDAEVLVESVPGTSPELAAAISGLNANGSTNIYDGLRTAYDVVEEHATEGLQNRVILLSDGQATAGITAPAKIVAMSEAYNEVGYGLSTIGMGSDFDVNLMRELSEVGAGAFYFLEDPSAVQEVFEEEVTSFLVPLAEEVKIDVDVNSGWNLRAVQGTKLSEIAGNSAGIDIPSLQIAHRLDDEDNENGRRGGGGAILVELLPNGQPGSGDVGDIHFSYREPGTGNVVTQDIEILSPFNPDDAPQAGYFAHTSVEKSFVMLNIYVGFDMAATRASVGDDAGALSVLVNLERNVDEWLDENPDFDIEDDLKYIRMFIENLQERGDGGPLEPDTIPPEPWPQD
jgi:Ca-activated chloride channel family protein